MAHDELNGLRKQREVSDHTAQGNDQEDATYNVRHGILSVVRCEEQGEEADDGDGVDEPRLNENADDPYQPLVPARTCYALGGHASVDSQDTIYDHA